MVRIVVHIFPNTKGTEKINSFCHNFLAYLFCALSQAMSQEGCSKGAILGQAKIFGTTRLTQDSIRMHISNLRNLKPTFVGVKKKVTFTIKTF